MVGILIHYSTQKSNYANRNVFLKTSTTVLKDPREEVVLPLSSFPVPETFYKAHWETDEAEGELRKGSVMCTV